jgi:heme-degrading monooxygenase HmoA
MHARSAVIDMPVEKIDEAVRFWEEEQLPKYREQAGYKGFTLLVNRDSGKVFGVSFWESEAAVRASDELARQARADLAQAGSGTEQPREDWEVAIDDQV